MRFHVGAATFLLPIGLVICISQHHKAMDYLLVVLLGKNSAKFDVILLLKSFYHSMTDENLMVFIILSNRLLTAHG